MLKEQKKNFHYETLELRMKHQEFFANQFVKERNHFLVEEVSPGAQGMTPNKDGTLARSNTLYVLPRC